MIGLSRAAGAEVLLLGMRIPPNYGPTYANQFAATYADLAKTCVSPGAVPAGRHRARCQI